MTDVTNPAPYTLDDRITRDHGTVFMSGTQALARILVEQLRVDRVAGSRTAAFVSGYPGSPVAGLDREIVAAARLAADLPIVFRPGLNEELAATAVMGSQLAQAHGEGRYDGVVGMWFGKAPGLDRACDAIRHAVFTGTDHRGGVVAVVGDDPAAKSSTIPSSSDATLVDLHIPIFYPVDLQDMLDLGRHAIALSRATGLWSGLKIVEQLADGTATVDLDPTRVRPVMPVWLVDGKQYMPKPDGRLLPPNNLAIEREILQIRFPLAQEYGRVNSLNRVVVDPGPTARVGIAACGYTFGETREALARLGLRTEADIASAGIRLLQLRMPYPLDASDIRPFAHGLAEVIVIEEKNPTLEWLVKNALWGSAERPVIVGKQDDEGAALFPSAGHLDADAILAPLRHRLARHLGDEQLAPLPRPPRPRIAVTESRTPWFCSGCPHNWGTKLPKGSLYGAGIGCHVMTTLQPVERVGELAALGAMGNEGAAWIGMEPFVTRDHFIQNLGDGTFFHSGQLAVHAAVAAGAHMTFKLLYNGAVAMTGGQDAQGAIAVPEVCTSLLAHGVSQILITTDDPSRYRRVKLPKGVDVWDRNRIVEAQERLKAVAGVTVLIHDQACAAELRRDRKRGKAPLPTYRVVINERVCEGCGDCGEKSGCLSLQPVATVFGTKTRIDQNSCNIDASCLYGDCPSFMTVAVPKATAKASPPNRRTDVPTPTELPAPPPPHFTDCIVRMAGIGGTGVVTVSQVLGTAAMLEGRPVRGLDQTGLSQKAGPVVSDVCWGASGGAVPESNKAGVAQVDVLLAFDLLVGASEPVYTTLIPGRSLIVGSTTPAATGQQIVSGEPQAPDTTDLEARMRELGGPEPVLFDAGRACTLLLGDATPANIMVLGAAVQAGAIDVSTSAIEEAIGLNGVAVKRNIDAFRWGRAIVADPDRVARAMAAADAADRPAPVAPPALRAALETRVQRLGGVAALVRTFCVELVAFGGPRAAARYLDRVEAVRRREAEVMGGSSVALTEAVARHLYQLTAYKDEYEVARLLVSPEATAAAEAIGGPGARFSWKLHPPMLKALGMKKKLSMAPWTRPVLVALAHGRRLRGTPFDPFGRAAVRRLERELLAEYVAVIERLARHLSSERHGDAVRIASLAGHVRGYEDRKVTRADEYRQQLATALADWPA